MNELAHCPRDVRARNMNGQLSMSTAVSKGTADFLAECGSGAFDGIAGTLGFSTRRPIPPTGALLDDLLLLCGIAPLLQADLKASPRLEFYATDASSSGAGACVAPVTENLWKTLCNLAEEQGEHVRLSWGSSPPPLELTPPSLLPICLCSLATASARPITSTCSNSPR